MSSPLARPIPSFDELPLRAGDPHHSAWGLWKNPALGALNHLTDDKVLKAAKEEIQTGERVTLNLPLDAVKPALLGRINFEQRMINKAPRVINDDIITFNTQTSAQWDSFRHFAYQAEGKFYNGVTQDDIHSGPDRGVNGIDGWAGKAIAGRGILIDYHSWASEKGFQYDSMSTHPIGVEEIEQILAARNIEVRRGDILFLRTGYVSTYLSFDTATKESLLGASHNWPGLKQGVEMTRWLWEQQFAAIAADSPALECIPPVDEKWMLHPILLAGWGTPIGELFDLDALADLCRRRNRWSFFVTSVPLSYQGAVASPPNAMVVF
ncbi:putative cyclase-domain-containing protein [Aspergillus welwitschiae]|uniref:Putative cyclase-domain-containing protein n=1 Tax=Aspergillus welwitschiae TaxID=1341132 RepID=A0A3F3PKZ0_9EURO|nr:putative cyclase-domain-containing protein [Aspergillus welwitschiae]RDH27579.1 putative cyclase-domain-containing protein [Aspergillus welwitschiae]